MEHPIQTATMDSEVKKEDKMEFICEWNVTLMNLFVLLIDRKDVFKYH